MGSTERKRGFLVATVAKVKFTVVSLKKRRVYNCFALVWIKKYSVVYLYWLVYVKFGMSSIKIYCEVFLIRTSKTTFPQSLTSISKKQL